MPPDIAAGLYLITHHLKHDLSGREAMVTCAYSDDSAPTATEMANVFRQRFDDHLQAVFDSSAKLEFVSCVHGLGNDQPEVGQSVAGSVTGSANQSSLPSNCSFLVKEQTAFGGRRNRGRMYWPWMITESEVDEVGMISQAHFDTRQDAFDDWLDALNDIEGGSYLTIANRHYDQPWTDPNRELLLIDAAHPVVRVQGDRLIATQRRRLGR